MIIHDIIQFVHLYGAFIWHKDLTVVSNKNFEVIPKGDTSRGKGLRHTNALSVITGVISIYVLADKKTRFYNRRENSDNSKKVRKTIRNWQKE